MRLERGRPSEQVDGFYDDFAVCPPGTFGHPSIDPGEREPSEDFIENAREAVTWGTNGRFEQLVARFARLFT